ncbi:Der GTPase-activating protein YihI [Oceanisphaera pacifica]|uniref:Der GTPase-activating protein YihI n=1 Tax=Oceanisphaera pacifica TaxID=2818389 RepID=A0ABS3NJM5_9GAMM|nr:Der GTPase-activating protein YihI [Oceanisphaera pacifica]MBO1520517.1 GTPase-activating protein [Oceanisphaera pacifica]
MTRIKKTRSPGQAGTQNKKRETAEQIKERKRKAKRNGLAPGSRQNVAEHTTKQGGNKANKDPRLGSKKPVALTPSSPASHAEKPPKPTKKQLTEQVASERAQASSELTAEQELEQLENNERLNNLLDKVDAGTKLNKADASWLDSTLARHQQLLEQLGLLEADDEEAVDGDDLWTRFMDAELDPAQYDDKEDKS